MEFDKLQKIVDEYELKNGKLPEQLELEPEDFEWFHQWCLKFDKGRAGLHYFNGIPVIRKIGSEGNK